MTKYERIDFNNEMLRSFVAIAQHGHLTLAAEELNRTQSALSVHLRKIEAALGTRLFERHARGMTLTTDGERLLPVAHHILSEMKRVGAMFPRPLRGKFSVGIPELYDDMSFETVLAEFNRAYPEVDLTVRSGCSSGCATDVEAGRLDIAIVSGPVQHSDHILVTVATYWCESDTFVQDPAKPLPLAVLDRGCWWSRMPHEALLEQGRDFNVTFRSSSFSNLRCAVRAGLAIGVLPARALQKGMRVADPSRRLPDLPPMTRSLLIAPGAPQEIVQTIATELRESLVKSPAAGPKQTRRL